MVANTMYAWLSSDHHHHKRISYLSGVFRHDKSDTLGILAFETAKTMSRIVSLYRSLTDDEVYRLKNHVIKSRGVLYLNSEDEGHLLNLACDERLEDLDRASNAVARLGIKCSDPGLNRLEQVYRNLKLGYVDLDKLINHGSHKDMDKVVEKMEKLISTTSNLYAELQALSELENSERRLIEWKKNASCDVSQHANFDLFEHKIAGQRKQVRHLKELSLWNQSYDKAVGMMARVVYYIYGRICHHFGDYIPVMPLVSSKDLKHRKGRPGHRHSHHSLLEDPSAQGSRSGPIVANYRSMPKVPLIRFLSQESTIFFSGSLYEDDEKDDIVGTSFGMIGCRDHGRNDKGSALSRGRSTGVFQAAPASTVGGSGLALRYANVILTVEKFMGSGTVIGDQARENLYHMLPTSLRTLANAKLRNAWKEMEECYGNGGEMALAEGWREAVRGIMEWLGPIAHDTLAWQGEKNLEKQRFDPKPTALLMQTLHYSDLVKTEAAIAEVLVGLSCIFWHENQRSEELEYYED